MGQTLCWKLDTPPSGTLSCGLRRAIGKWKFGGDGSIWDDEVTLSCDDIPFLEGLNIAGIEDADELIDLIREHAIIVLYVAI